MTGCKRLVGERGRNIAVGRLQGRDAHGPGNAGQRRLPFDEGHVDQIDTIGVQAVEEERLERDVGAGLAAKAASGLLEEPGYVILVQADELAVQDYSCGRQ